MTLGSVPLGRTMTRAPSASDVAQPVGGRQRVAAQREVVDPLDGEAAQGGRRGGAQPLHGRGDGGEVVEAHRELVGGVQPVLAGDVVEEVGQAAALGLGRGRDLADQQQRGDAVLVLHVLGVDAVAQRLLVAEGEALDAADPLEAGERLLVRLPGRGGHLAEQARRTRSSWRRCPATPRASRWWASSAPTSSPRSIRQPCGSGTATAQRSASGSLATTMSAPLAAASAIARSIAPGSSGLGKATVGKSGSGCSCCSTTCGASKPAVSRTCATVRAADAVQRGVDDRQVAGTVLGEAGDGVEVAVDDLLADDLAGVAAGDVGERADGGDPLGDLGVGGGTIWLPSPR